MIKTREFLTEIPECIFNVLQFWKIDRQLQLFTHSSAVGGAITPGMVQSPSWFIAILTMTKVSEMYSKNKSSFIGG